MTQEPQHIHHLSLAREALAAGNLPAAEQASSEALVRDPGCVEACQTLALTYIAMGEHERAQSLLDRREEFPKTDAFAAWADIAEQLEHMDVAVEIYADHLTRYPRDAEAHYRLGLAALAQDRRDRAKASLHSAVKLDPAASRPAAELARLYEEEGLFGTARELYDRALAAAPDDAELEAARDMVDARIRSLQALPEARIEPVEAAAQALLRLFAGRDGVHARQWADAEDRVGYAPVHEPLTARLLEAHVRGELTAGVYPVRADNTVRFLAFDIDITRRMLEQTETDPEERGRLDRLVMEDAKRLTVMLDRLELPYAVESSGYKGCHVWLCLSSPASARQARAFARALDTQIGPPPGGLHREIFPKQDSVPEGQLGNLIKLPLGIHRKTGRRALFVDADGRAYADQTAYLEGIRTVSAEDFERAINRLIGARMEDHEAQDRDAPAVREISANAIPDMDTLKDRFPSLAPLWERCAVARALIRKAQTEHHLAHAERVVLACLFVHLGEEGVALLHAVIANCLDYSHDVTRYQIGRTRSNPISCPRIRQHIPDITSQAGCACDMKLPENGYPSPVLFIDPEATAGRARPRPENREMDTLVGQYVELMGRRRALLREIEAAARTIRERLENSEDGALVTDTWRVTHNPDTGDLRVELRNPE